MAATPGQVCLKYGSPGTKKMANNDSNLRTDGGEKEGKRKAEKKMTQISGNNLFY